MKNSNNAGDHYGGGNEERIVRRRLGFVMIFVFIAMILQGTAMMMMSSDVIVIVSGVLGIAVAGTTAWKQLLLQRMETMKNVHNKIRREVNRFKTENGKLTENVNGLETNIIELQKIERHIARIAEEHGLSAHELNNLVRENKKTINEQKVSGIKTALKIQKRFF